MQTQLSLLNSFKSGAFTSIESLLNLSHNSDVISLGFFLHGESWGRFHFNFVHNSAPSFRRSAVFNNHCCSQKCAQKRVYNGIAAHSPPAAESDMVWTFAYGANMNESVLRRRGVKPLQSLPAELTSHRLLFNHRGAFGNIALLEEGALVPHVHGVVHKIQYDDFLRLQRFELGYRTSRVKVTTYEGKSLEAIAFISENGMLLSQSLPPPARYLELLQEGACFWQLDGAYVAWLRGHEAVRSAQRGPAYFATPNAAAAEAALKGLALLALALIAAQAQP